MVTALTIPVSSDVFLVIQLAANVSDQAIEALEPRPAILVVVE
jgi:hypothetical protein